MFLKIFFLWQLAWGSNVISVESVQYQNLMDSPSCELLYFRQIERSKVIREAIYILGLEYESPMARIMTENTLINNKLFLDNKVWEDLTTEVMIVADLDENLLQAINDYGFDRIYFSIKGPGLTWNSVGSSISPEIKVDFLITDQKVIITYPIYKGDECNKENTPVNLAWLGPHDDWSIFFSHENLKDFSETFTGNDSQP